MKTWSIWDHVKINCGIMRNKLSDKKNRFGDGKFGGSKENIKFINVVNIVYF